VAPVVRLPVVPGRPSVQQSLDVAVEILWISYEFSQPGLVSSARRTPSGSRAMTVR
jgi:hypothetical protein